MLLADPIAAHAAMLDLDGDPTDATRTFDAGRMRLIEAYERAYER